MANWKGEEKGGAFIITASMLAIGKRQEMSATVHQLYKVIVWHFLSPSMKPSLIFCCFHGYLA
jgi:hypothetical protein